MSDNEGLITSAAAAVQIFTDAQKDGLPAPYNVNIYPSNNTVMAHFDQIADLERWATWRGVTETHHSHIAVSPDEPSYVVEVMVNGSERKHATLRARMHGVKVMGFASGRATDAEVWAAREALAVGQVSA